MTKKSRSVYCTSITWPSSISDFVRPIVAETVNCTSFRTYVSRVQSFLAELRDEGKSIQTSNHYLRAIKQLTRWMVKDRRAHDDPLAFVAMLNVSTDRRHDRRPLTEAEFTALLNAARGGRSVLGMPYSSHQNGSFCINLQ